MKYESNILKRLIDTYGVVGNPRYLSEIIKEFIVRGKELYPQLFTYQADWLAHIDEFGLTPEYVVGYTGQQIYAPHTKERPVKRAILKGSTKYRDIDTGEVLDVFEDGRNLELVSVRMPVLMTANQDNILGKCSVNVDSSYGGYIKKLTDTTGEFKVTDSSQNVRIKFDGVNTIIGRDKWCCVTVRFDEDMSNVNFSMSRGWTLLKDNRTLVFKGLTYGGNGIEALVLTSNRGLVLNQLYTFEVISIIPILSTWTFDDYEPYKTNILTVNEDVTLRGIGDVKDELNLLTSELTQRIGEIVLDGSEDWNLNNSNTGTNTIIPYLNNYFTKQTKMIMAEFPRYSGNNIWGSNVDYECYLDNTETIAIRINKDKLVTADINGFKQWLSQNPITVQYELVSESVKKVDLTVKDQNDIEVSQLISFNGGTHFSTSSQLGSLLPSISVDVVTDLEETLNLCSTDGNTL